ncbi:MAG TPA: hypothetical protein VF972_09625 [Actinomycetota bacterium]
MRKVTTVAALLGLLGAGLAGSVTASAAGRHGDAGPRLLPRGGRISSIARPEASSARIRSARPGVSTCTTPGSANYKANCNSTGRPTNETTIANNGTTFVAGSNDYNSYNGNADLGYYWSTDAKTWNDAGPLDLYPNASLNAAGDPGLAIDAAGNVYYSNIFFSYTDCTVGGVELSRYDAVAGTWSYYQIAANSDNAFQDKPAVAQDGTRVWVSWTEYGSCSGVDVPSPIKVAVFAAGGSSGPPKKILSVPGSTYSQGSSMIPDGHGGFFITWEEFPSPSATVGSIKLAHFKKGIGWNTPSTISPPGFQDLPSPLPGGYVFRDNSFPWIALLAGKPRVVWASYDTGVGRVYLWQNGQVSTVSDSGGDQFFSSVFADGSKLEISWSQTMSSNQSYDQYLSDGGVVSKISTASSFPNKDTFFGGSFIGDYNTTTGLNGAAHPVWTDIRGPTYAQNTMVYAA